jgi:hypothetical protein
MPSQFETMRQIASTPVLENHFGVSVVFARGADVTEAFTARRNDKIHHAIGQEFGLEVRITMRDFILPVASLVIDSVTIEPRTGDRITEGSEVFEIQPPDDQKPSVELQTGGYEYLVHTKRIQ